MRKIFLVATCLLSTLVYAQKNISFKLGSEFSFPKGSKDLAFFVNPQDGIVNLSFKKDEMTIARQDATSFAQSAEKVIEVESPGKNFISDTAIALNNNYYWLHSDWDKEMEREYLYYDRLDVRNGKITVANKKMIETTQIADDFASREIIKPLSIIKRPRSPKYAYYFDISKTKLLVTYKLRPEERSEKKNYDKIGLAVFDNQMNKVWSGEFTMPYTEAVMDNKDFAVDSTGNAYLLAKVFDNDKGRAIDKKTGEPAYHYELMKFSKDSKKMTTATLSLGDKFIRRSALVENNLHEMIITGTYSNSITRGGTDGLYMSVLNESNTIVPYKQGTYEFPAEEMRKFETARTLKKMEAGREFGFANLGIASIIIEGDGGIFVACEEFYLTSNSHTSGATGMSYSTLIWNYEDMLAVKINPAGTMSWVKKLPKRQWGNMGRSMMSFKLMHNTSGYHFLYLDNINNLNLPENEIPKQHVNGHGGYLMVYSVSNEGKVSKNMLFDTRPEEIMVFPYEFEQLDGNQFIGRARVKGSLKYKPVMVSLP